MCASTVNRSGQETSPETGNKRWRPSCRLARREAGVHFSAFRHRHPNCQPVPFCLFSHCGATGTSENVKVPSRNPGEQDPEDKGLPRTRLARHRFSPGPESRKVNKALPPKPEIPSKRIPGRRRAAVKNTETRTMSRAQSQKFIDAGLCRYISWKKKKEVLRKQMLAVDVRAPTLAV